MPTPNAERGSIEWGRTLAEDASAIIDLRNVVAASLKSFGNALAPAMTLNRMYHCVPRIISGLSQMTGETWNLTIR